MTASDSKIAVVINPSSGRLHQLTPTDFRDRVERIGRDKGASFDFFFPPVDQLSDRVSELADRYRLIWICGGDGTVNLAAAGMIGRDAALGVIPAGTFNFFALDLGLPTDLDQAVSGLLRGRIQAVDVGEIDGRVFVHNTAAGLHPQYLLQRKSFQRNFGLPKMPASGLGYLTALFKAPKIDILLDTPEDRADAVTPFLYVLLNRYQNKPFSILGRQSLTDGKLSLFYADQVSRRGVVKIIGMTLLGRMAETTELGLIQTPRATIKTHTQRMNLAIDGDVVTLYPPAELRIRSRAINAILPPQSRFYAA
jgi:diacylglycerol kinase family enzyme